jgi:hypothetical protein
MKFQQSGNARGEVTANQFSGTGDIMKAINMHQNDGQNLGMGSSDSVGGEMLQGGICADPMLVNLDSDPIVLTETEIASLLYMIEEEKMAMDLYDAFAEQTGSTIFERISDAELRHMNTLVQVAEAADVDLSGISPDAGVFNDTQIQDLYNTLLAQGSLSFDDAIDVGIFVEETDIADLQNYNGGDEVGLLGVVYDHLEAGSVNHLAAFTQYDVVAA